MSPTLPRFSMLSCRITCIGMGVSLDLGRHVGEECHVARLLHCARDLLLVLLAVSRDAAGNDLPALAREVLEGVGVLEVDRDGRVGAEAADAATAETPSSATLVFAFTA